MITSRHCRRASGWLLLALAVVVGGAASGRAARAEVPAAGAIEPATQPAAALLWLDDLNHGQKQAQAQGRDIVLLFTNPGGRWSRLMDEELLAGSDFARFAATRFVLVRIDLSKVAAGPAPATQPGDAAAAAALQQQRNLVQRYNQWAKRFAVDKLPLLYLCDAQGRAYARAVYRHGGAEAYAAYLQELAENKGKRDKLFTQAAAAQGVDQARLLDQALVLLDEQQARIGYENQVRQILAGDPENQTGTHAKYLGPAHCSKVDQLYVARNFGQAVAEVDAFVNKYHPQGELLQALLGKKGLILGEHLGRRAEAIPVLDAAVQAAPKGFYAGGLAAKAQQMRQAVGAPAAAATQPVR